MIAATNWNEWVGIGTLALAVATPVLRLATVVGVSVAARAARDTRKLVEVAEEEVGAVSPQAEASREQAAASQEQAKSKRKPHEPRFEASVQPLLGPGRLDEFDDANQQADRRDVKIRARDEFVFLSLPQRNVGTGVALVTRVPQ